MIPLAFILFCAVVWVLQELADARYGDREDIDL